LEVVSTSFTKMLREAAQVVKQTSSCL